MLLQPAPNKDYILLVLYFAQRHCLPTASEIKCSLHVTGIRHFFLQMHHYLLLDPERSRRLAESRLG